MSPQKDVGIREQKIKAKQKFSTNTQELIGFGITLFKSGLPTSVSLVCNYASGLICLRFAAKYSSPTELAGTTLGFTWSTVFCIAILSSINQGFSVLAAQLVGAKKQRELGELFQRNLCVIAAIMLPLLLSLYFSDKILVAIGLNYDVSINTGIYLRHVIPSVMSLGFFECLRYYLIAQNYFYIQPIIQGSFAVIHVFWCYLFVDILNLSISGIGIAKSITDISTLAALWLYIKFSGKFNQSWIPWKRSCVEEWGSYLKTTLILGANSYIEWISLEASLFIVGGLGDEYILGAQGLGVTLMNLFFMLPSGNCVSMQAFMGNATGEGSVSKAQKFMSVGLGMNFVITLINILVLTIWSDHVAAFFTGDEQTKEILKSMLNIYSVGHIADTFVNHLTGALKILGKEREVFLCFLISYSIIAVNCEWIFGLFFNYGYPAVWFSMISGMYLMLIWSIWKVSSLDWSKEIDAILERIKSYRIEDKLDNTKYIELIEL